MHPYYGDFMSKKAEPTPVSSVLSTKASQDLDTIIAEELLLPDAELDMEELINENTKRNDRAGSTESN